jgi:hypothetical protein
MTGILYTVVLATFAKLRKAKLAFPCLSAWKKKLGSHWTDFHEIWYFNIFRKSFENIPHRAVTGLIETFSVFGSWVSPFWHATKDLRERWSIEVEVALGTRRGEGSASRPGRILPPGKTWYLLYRWLGGPQGRSGQMWKISPPPVFDPRTVQSVASRYTDWAISTLVSI